MFHRCLSSKLSYNTSRFNILEPRTSRTDLFHVAEVTSDSTVHIGLQGNLLTSDCCQCTAQRYAWWLSCSLWIPLVRLLQDLSGLISHHISSCLIISHHVSSLKIGSAIPAKTVRPGCRPGQVCRPLCSPGRSGQQRRSPFVMIAHVTNHDTYLPYIRPI